jgi:FMN-dependent NADH-azoreductase
MKTLLKITAGLSGAHGQSAQLADEYVRTWLAQNPDGRVVTRDLSTQPVPHLTAERFEAFGTPETSRNAAQHEIVSFSDVLIGELKSADTIVFAVPMYNFSVPSTLRAYFDHIARANVTFRYTAEGPRGLIEGKEAYVFITRGGIYPQAADTQTPYIRQFLGFIGITDVHFVHAEGLAMGDAARDKGLAGARNRIATFAPLRAVA